MARGAPARAGRCAPARSPGVRWCSRAACSRTTLWRGDIHLTVPMLFALSFIVTFVNGGLTGLFLGNPVVDVPLSDTMFVVAHFHMVMGMAPIFVIFGAIYHWYPGKEAILVGFQDDFMEKLTGRVLSVVVRPPRGRFRPLRASRPRHSEPASA